MIFFTVGFEISSSSHLAGISSRSVWISSGIQKGTFKRKYSCLVKFHLLYQTNDSSLQTFVKTLTGGWWSEKAGFININSARKHCVRFEKLSFEQANRVGTVNNECRPLLGVLHAQSKLDQARKCSPVWFKSETRPFTKPISLNQLSKISPWREKKRRRSQRKRGSRHLTAVLFSCNTHTQWAMGMGPSMSCLRLALSGD